MGGPSVKFAPKTRLYMKAIKSSSWKGSLLKATTYLEIIGIRGQQKKAFCTIGRTEKQSMLQNKHDVLMHVRPIIRVYSRNNTNSTSNTPLYKSKTAYYDILHVSPSATQAQIKTAYYRQSFVYHPDRNAGTEEAKQRFAEISEAYTILGDRTLKKKYDCGILTQADIRGAGRPSGREATGPKAAERQRTSRASPMAGASAKPLFDFDAFFRAHYSEQLQREKEFRWQRQQMRKKQEAKLKDWKLGKMTEISVGFLLALGVAILLSMKSGN